MFLFFKMELTNQEKEALKYILQKEIKEVEEQGEEIRPNVSFLAVEERYEDLLKLLLKKIK